MYIHNSHTKEQIIKIIKLLEIDVPHSNLVKKEIINNLSEFVELYYDMKFLKNPLFFKNIKDLEDYFKEESNCIKKIISSKDKEKLLINSRRIINFVINGCDYDLSFFKDTEDIHYTILFVCKFGGTISTCRRAINMINSTLPPNKKYEMDFDDATLKHLQDKELKKYLAIPKFHRKFKKVYLSFD